MKLLITIAILLLSGCASVGERVLTAGTTGSIRFSPQDVDAAILIAQQAGDKVGEGCYKAIRTHLDAPDRPQTHGVVSTYAAARVALRAARAPLAEDVHLACSPLVIDAGQFASRLGLTFGTLP